MGTVTVLIGRFKGGSSSAFAALFGRFFSGVLRKAQRFQAPARGGLQRPEDIAQDVFFSLWREVTTRRRRVYDNLRDETSLRVALALLTRQRVRRSRRYDRCPARDSALTVPLPSDGIDAGGPAESVTPGFLRALEAKDSLQELVGLLGHPRERAIVCLLLDDVPQTEIARQLNCSTRTVRRHLETIHTIWRTHPRAQRLLQDLEVGLPAECQP